MVDAVVTVRPPTGGGGAGNWTDDIEEATLDGDIALEAQDAAPSAIVAVNITGNDQIKSTKLKIKETEKGENKSDHRRLMFAVANTL